MTKQNTAAVVPFKVTIKESEIPMDQLLGWSVEQDFGQPDMCMVTLRNENHGFSDMYTPRDSVIIEAGVDSSVIFTGELVGMEPEYRANGENVLCARAFNRLHNLTRGSKSRTYTDTTDYKIVHDVASRANLNPICGENAKTIHAHVYQNNQTDLEFLRMRAARIGFEVWVQGDDLHFDAPNAKFESKILLRYGDAASSKASDAVFLKRFTPKLSSSGILQKLEVRGWDPVAKKEIIAVAEAQEIESGLGSKPAHSAVCPPDGGYSSFNVKQPVYTQEEAKNLAKSKLAAANMGYMTGTGECRGTPGIKPGVVVTITVNPDHAGDRFNGKYMVVGACHRYSSKKLGSQGGYVTSFRVSRDAEGGEDT